MEAEDAGVDLGRRREGAGRQGKEQLDRAVELHGRAEHAIVAGAGCGGDALGDFALHHQDGAIDGGVVRDEVEQDVGGDVVGQIADDRRACVRAPGPAR